MWCDRQCRSYGHTVWPHRGRWLWKRSLAPITLGHFVLVNPHCVSYSRRRTADQPVVFRTPLLQCQTSEIPTLNASPYDPFVAYGRSGKTANILFAVAFDKRHRSRGVRGCGCTIREVHTD